MSFKIYGLVKNSEIHYVGWTSRALSTRRIEHISKGRIDEDYDIVLIEETETKADALRLEILYQKELGVLGKLNRCLGSAGAAGMKMSREAKEKISAFHKGKQWGLGRKWTDERRAAHSKRLIGIKKREGSTNESMVKKGVRAFRVYKNGLLVGEFVNQTHAAIACGIAKSTFVEFFKGKTKSNNHNLEIKFCA